MSEIKLKLHPRYLRDKAASEEFLVKRIDDGTITVYYRYGNGAKNSMMMDGLNRMLEWNFGEDS